MFSRKILLNVTETRRLLELIDGLSIRDMRFKRLSYLVTVSSPV
jgi:hypothetical protein